MSALDELNKLIANSKFISDEKKLEHARKIKEEIKNPMDDFLKGFKKNEKTNIYKK